MKKDARKKIVDKTREKYKRFHRSDYSERISALTKQYVKDPALQKQVSDIIVKYGNAVIIEKNDGITIKTPKVKAELDKLGVGFVVNGRALPKQPLEIRIDKNNVPSIYPATADYTEKDIKDLLPLYMIYKNKLQGEAPNRAGKKENTAQYKAWRQELKTRKGRGEKADVILDDIRKRHGYKPSSTFAHKKARSKKYN